MVPLACKAPGAPRTAALPRLKQTWGHDGHPDHEATARARRLMLGDTMLAVVAAATGALQAAIHPPCQARHAYPLVARRAPFLPGGGVFVLRTIGEP